MAQKEKMIDSITEIKSKISHLSKNMFRHHNNVTAHSLLVAEVKLYELR